MSYESRKNESYPWSLECHNEAMQVWTYPATEVELIKPDYYNTKKPAFPPLQELLEQGWIRTKYYQENLCSCAFCGLSWVQYIAPSGSYICATCTFYFGKQWSVTIQEAREEQHQRYRKERLKTFDKLPMEEE